MKMTKNVKNNMKIEKNVFKQFFTIFV